MDRGSRASSGASAEDRWRSHDRAVGAQIPALEERPQRGEHLRVARLGCAPQPLDHDLGVDLAGSRHEAPSRVQGPRWVETLARKLQQLSKEWEASGLREGRR